MKTFEELIYDYLIFAEKTFPLADSESSVHKLAKESDEFYKSVVRGESKKEIADEASDCLMCIVFALKCKGISIREFKESLESKIEVNKGRIWAHNGDGTYSHVKTKKPA